MSKHNEKNKYRPVVINRDHARPRNAPAPSDPGVQARLTELVSPAVYSLVAYYRSSGLRERILTLPVMAAAVLTMIWRQVPSGTEVVRMLAREPLLWARPTEVTQQAFDLRLRTLPAELFRKVLETILPTLLARAAARKRQQPKVVQRVLRHFERIWIVDATTLEDLFRKVGALRGMPEIPQGGKLLSVLDLPSKLPVQVWHDPDSDANEKSFLDQLKTILVAGTLLIFDRGFYAFPFFDWLTEQGLSFVSRAREVAAFKVTKVFLSTPLVRDRIVEFGQYRSNPCVHPVRLIEVCVGGTWHSYLTNVLDPSVLSPADVVDLYGRRWRIEEAFLLVKRLLGLAYLWNGSVNGIQLQLYATWLLYGVLIDLCDAVAQELSVQFDLISVEMVYRGLYHFTVAHQRGEASDPVKYLADPAQADLGIVKRRRKYRERARLDKMPQELNL